MLAVTQWYLLRPSLRDQGESLCEYLTIFCPFILLFCTMPIFCTRWETIQRATSRDMDYYMAQRAWPKHEKYHTTHPVYLLIEKLAMKARMQAVREGRSEAVMPWDPRTGNLYDPLDLVRPDSEALHASPDAGRLIPGDCDDDGTAEAEGSEMETIAGEEEDVMETAAVARVDPARLALEDAKFRVPLCMLGDGGESEDASIEDISSSDDDGTEDDDRHTTRPLAGEARPAMLTLLRPGILAEVAGPSGKMGSKYNGTTCALKFYDSIAEKWVVELQDGKKAKLAANHLEPMLSFAPGMKVRIQGLTSATRFNGAVVTIKMWDASLEKWICRMFTGRDASIAPFNLGPLDSGEEDR